MCPQLRPRKCFIISSLLCFYLLFNVESLKAQSVSGTVRSPVNNQPLAGVSVEVKGGSNGTTTDGKGYYQLKNVAGGDSLVFSYVGFRTQTMATTRGRSTTPV